MLNNTHSHKHHFVPQWYQRKFLPGGKGEFFVLDKNPLTQINCPDGQMRDLKNVKHIRRSGTGELFQQKHLYSLHMPLVSPDILERTLFGALDNNGSVGNKLLCLWPKTIPRPNKFPMHLGDPNKCIINLLEYINAQKTRTPKGIEVLMRDVAQYTSKTDDHNLPMYVFMKRRQDYCTVWLEAHWQIFSTPSKESRFLLSDEPVIHYNMDCYPGAQECTYPNDPNPFWRGTRILHPLSSTKLLVLTHKEHVDKPSRRKPKQIRRNARYFDQANFSYLWIENEKILTAKEVLMINHVIKARATQFIASSIQDDLFPQKKLKFPTWSKIDEIFHPKYKSYHSESTIHYGFKDGGGKSFNAFGEEIPEEATRLKEQFERIIKKDQE